MIVRHCLAAGVISLAAVGGAHAEGWIFRVGAQVGVSPPYEGANRDILEPAPTFDLRPKSSPQRFTPPDGGTTFAILANQYVEIGPVVRFRYQRSDKGELQGFEKLGVAVEPGLYMDLWPASWLRLRVEGRHGEAGHYGWVGDTGFDLVYTGGRWDASIGPRIGWGDRRYMQTYFGVSPEAAALSPRIHQVYSPAAGQRYTGLETAVAYNVDRRWRIIFDIGYQRLASVGADSPIVRTAGSPDQYSSSLGFSYSFGVGR